MHLKNNPIIYLAKKTWQYSAGNRRHVILFLLLFICANILNFFEPLIVAKVFNIMQIQGINNNSLPTIIFYLFSLILLSLGFWSFHYPARLIEQKNAFLMRANYKKYLLEGTMSLPAGWHTDHHSGDSIDKIEKATNALFQFASTTFEIIETTLMLVGSYLALIYFNLHSIYIVLFITCLAVFIILKHDRTLVKQYSELFKAENRISAKIFDVISNITTVIILRIERLLAKSIFKKIMEPFTLYRRNIKINETKWFLVSLCNIVMVFLVLSSFIYFNIKTGTTVMLGVVYALYSYVRRINETFYRFAYMYGDIVQRKTAVANVEEISNEFKDSRKTKYVKLDSKWRELKIKNLNFSYQTEEGAKMHLNNITITINRGDKVALIGESGSGKTTLLKIMRGLYQPKQIRLHLDGKPLPNGFNSISSQIALIPQDPEIFTTTIKDNITVGVERTISLVRKYSTMAQFDEVAQRLPKKYNSSIVEKGVNLSGGEKQRLALARGLMACEDKAIILLDEPTSSIDFKNEARIYQNIFAEFKNRTVLSSIHRLHLLPLFDQIYYFANGKIIASGTLTELLTESEEFKKIWERYNNTTRRYQ